MRESILKLNKQLCTEYKSVVQDSVNTFISDYKIREIKGDVKVQVSSYFYFDDDFTDEEKKEIAKDIPPSLLEYLSEVHQSSITVLVDVVHQYAVVRLEYIPLAKNLGIALSEYRGSDKTIEREVVVIKNDNAVEKFINGDVEGTLYHQFMNFRG